MTTLRFVVRTPHAVVLEIDAHAVRVPTDSGHVGLRPRAEPLVLGVEPGLVSIRDVATTTFAATAGGLLELDRSGATLFTPLAIAGADPDDVVRALERALSEPDGDVAVRRRLAQLEQGIVGELRPAGATRPRRQP